MLVQVVYEDRLCVCWFMCQSCSVLAVQPVNVFQCTYVVDWGEPEHIPHSQSVSVSHSQKIMYKTDQWNVCCAFTKMHLKTKQLTDVSAVVTHKITK